MPQEHEGHQLCLKLRLQAIRGEETVPCSFLLSLSLSLALSGALVLALFFSLSPAPFSLSFSLSPSLLDFAHTFLACRTPILSFFTATGVPLYIAR